MDGKGLNKFVDVRFANMKAFSLSFLGHLFESRKECVVTVVLAFVLLSVENSPLLLLVLELQIILEVTGS